MDFVAILIVVAVAIGVAVFVFKGVGVASYTSAVSAELIRLGASPLTVKAVWTLDGVHAVIYKCRTEGIAPSACAAMINEYTASLAPDEIEAAVAKVMPKSSI